MSFSGVIGNQSRVAQNVPEASIHPMWYLVPKKMNRYVHPDIMNQIGT